MINDKREFNAEYVVRLPKLQPFNIWNIKMNHAHHKHIPNSISFHMILPLFPWWPRTPCVQKIANELRNKWWDSSEMNSLFFSFCNACKFWGKISVQWKKKKRKNNSRDNSLDLNNIPLIMRSTHVHKPVFSTLLYSLIAEDECWIFRHLINQFCIQSWNRFFSICFSVQDSK